MKDTKKMAEEVEELLRWGWSEKKAVAHVVKISCCAGDARKIADLTFFLEERKAKYRRINHKHKKQRLVGVGHTARVQLILFPPPYREPPSDCPF